MASTQYAAAALRVSGVASAAAAAAAAKYGYGRSQTTSPGDDTDLSGGDEPGGVEAQKERGGVSKHRGEDAEDEKEAERHDAPRDEGRLLFGVDDGAAWPGEVERDDGSGRVRSARQQQQQQQQAPGGQRLRVRVRSPGSSAADREEWDMLSNDSSAGPGARDSASPRNSPGGGGGARAEVVPLLLWSWDARHGDGHDKVSRLHDMHHEHQPVDSAARNADHDTHIDDTFPGDVSDSDESSDSGGSDSSGLSGVDTASTISSSVFASDFSADTQRAACRQCVSDGDGESREGSSRGASRRMRMLELAMWRKRSASSADMAFADSSSAATSSAEERRQTRRRRRQRHREGRLSRDDLLSASRRAADIERVKHMLRLIEANAGNEETTRAITRCLLTSLRGDSKPSQAADDEADDPDAWIGAATVRRGRRLLERLRSAMRGEEGSDAWPWASLAARERFTCAAVAAGIMMTACATVGPTVLRHASHASGQFPTFNRAWRGVTDAVQSSTR